jgi:superfamily II DNA or RNA helicase
MNVNDSKVPSVHPYGPTLAYLESHVSGNPKEYFDTLHCWVSFALDNPQHERQYDWEQYYPVEDGDDRSPIPKHRWKNIPEEEKQYFELRKVAHGKSEFTKRIIENTEEEKLLYVSIRIATLIRMGVFRLIKQEDEGKDLIQRIIVPKWTRDWYDARVSEEPTTELDQSFARDCIKAMWFIGEEWELLYSLRNMLNSVLKTKFESRNEIWSRMQKRSSYRTKEGKESQRVGSVLRMLWRAGLVEEKDGAFRNTDKQKSLCEPFRNNWCPILVAEEIHRGEILEWAEKEGHIGEEEKGHLQNEIFGQWAIASAHIESHTSAKGGVRRTNTLAFNIAMCKIQEAIWGGRYHSHMYQDAKSRKKKEHVLNGTIWPIFRIENLYEKKLGRWGSTSWNLLSLKKLQTVGLSQPRRSKWTGNKIETDGTSTSLAIHYKTRAAEIIGIEFDDPIITSLNWMGKRNAFKFLEHLEWVKDKGGTESELKDLLELTIPEFNKELMSRNLDSNRPALTYPDSFVPHEWQKEASKGWWDGKANLDADKIESIDPQTGIVEVVTGAGKTVFAIKIIKEFLEKDSENKSLIIVPTEVLLHQWYRELTKYLNLGPRQVSLIGDNNHGSLYEEEGTRVAIGIVNSLSMDHVYERIRSKGMPDPGQLLVIADECHRFRGEKFRKAMEWYIRAGDSKLGLSATPLGEKDDVDVGEEDEDESKLIVSGFLGKRSYFYGYERARDDGLIPEFAVNLVGFDLNSRERAKYKLHSEKISRSRKKILDAVGYRLDRMRGGFEAKINKLVSDGMKIPGVKDYFQAIRDRKDLLSHGIDKQGLENRQACFEKILKDTLSSKGKATEKKVLVFQERISQIQDTMFPSEGEIRSMLETRYYRPSSVHSRRARYRDRMTLDLLIKSVVNVIYSAKKLDEGLDVPAVDVGIVRIPNSSLRTTIQRLGRILRTKKGKESSEFWVLYARDTTETRFFENADFKKRISDDVIEYYTWNSSDNEIDVQEESEITWGPKQPDVDWSSISIGDPVRARIEGGQFSVSSNWIPFIKKKDSNEIETRMRIRNPDYIEVATVMKEMNKAGAVYHDLNGNCVTYRKGKGGTFIGTIDSSIELDLVPYPRHNHSNKASHLIRAPKGSNLEKLLGMLSDDDDMDESN